MPARRKLETITEEETVKYCDNHPARKAVLITSSDGSHAEIALCADCIPSAWKNRV